LRRLDLRSPHKVAHRKPRLKERLPPIFQRKPRR
jgi:hypothetical protein